MLTSDDLLKENNVSDFSEISLELYKKFFIDVLCERIFLYSLKDGSNLKLTFIPNNFLHILGGQHILGLNYKASKFNDQIDKGTMTFQELEKKNSKVFNDFTDRFLNFSNIYHVITNCTIVYFSKDTYEKNKKSKKESSMDFSHILYKDLNNKKIHLGIDTFNGKSFFGKSLLVKSINNDVITKDQTHIEIKKIEVKDNKTNKIIEVKNYDAVGQAALVKDN